MEHAMNDDARDHTEAQGDGAPDGRGQARPPEPEVHRERELIVTNSGGRSSGAGTAVIVIFAFVALIVIAVVAFVFLQRDGGGIVPDEVDINIEVPEVPSGTDGS